MITFFDTETIGFSGPIVLFQYAFDDGPIQLWDVFINPIQETLDLYKKTIIDSDGVVGFNLTFDHFHVCQSYTTLHKLGLMVGFDKRPIDYLDDMVEAEKNPSDLCLKPKSMCDVMVVAKKGQFSFTARRKPIKIRKIPSLLSEQVADQLRRELRNIHRGALLTTEVSIKESYPTHDRNGIRLCDLWIEFKSAAKLKTYAKELQLGGPGKEIIVHEDTGLTGNLKPKERGDQPINQPKRGWRTVAEKHVYRWQQPKNRQYAYDDIIYTREFYNYLGRPALGDDDSTLTGMVGAVRWSGFALDTRRLEQIRIDAISKIAETPTKVKAVQAYILEALDPIEKILLKNTAKETLTALAEMTVNPEAARRALLVKDARIAKMRAAQAKKKIEIGRYRPSFSVVGTLSNRMGGDDKTGAQGTIREKEFRSCFTLAEGDQVLCGGDFDQFELTIAEAVFKCKHLTELLEKNESLHAIFGTYCFREMTKEQVLATKGTVNDIYTKVKSAVFAVLYGGNASTLQRRLNISVEASEYAYNRFLEEFPEIKILRENVFNVFTSLVQVGGIGTRIDIREPDDYIETMYGFRRDFSLENKIVRILYDVSNNLDKEIERIGKTFKVIRNQPRSVADTERVQLGHGAVKTALFAGAFGLQGFIGRAANNLLIQSVGAESTKKVQRNVWDCQPAGIGKWHVKPLNIHDEVLSVCSPEKIKEVEQVVYQTINKLKQFVPFMSMHWKVGMKSWGEKS